MRYSEMVEAGARRAIRHLDDLKAIIVEISISVFLISALSEMFMLRINYFRVTIGERDAIALALTGAGGVIGLSLILLTFVYFLRVRTKRLKELEVKVVSAFMKALDESPLKSEAMDKKYGEQLNSQ